MSDQTLTEAEKKFLAFDWSKSQEWQTYYSNLYPTPDATKVPKFKRTWFRRNVDSTLSEDSTVGDPVDKKPDASASQAPKPDRASPKPDRASSTPKPDQSAQYPPGFPKEYYERMRHGTGLPLAKEFVVRLEFVLLVGFVLATLAVLTARFRPSNSEVLYKNTLLLSKAFFLIYLVVALFREQGLPKFNLAYLSSLVNNQNVHYVVYALSFVNVHPRFIFLVPQLLTAVLALNAMYKSYPAVFPRLLRTKKAKELLSVVDTNQYLLLKARGNFEVLLVPYLLVTLLATRAYLVSLVVYLNFLRMKLTTKDTYVMNTLKTVHMKVLQFLNQPNVPGVARNVYQKVVKGLELYFMGRRS